MGGHFCSECSIIVYWRRTGYRATGIPTATSPPSEILRSAMPPSGWEAKRAGNTYAGYRMLVAQEYAQEAIVNRQRAVARVIEKAQRPELVHVMTDP